MLEQMLQYISGDSGIHDRMTSHYAASTSQPHPGTALHNTAQQGQTYRCPVAEIAEQYDDETPTYGREDYSQAQSIGIPPPTPNPPTPRASRGWLRWFGFGALFAVVLQFVIGWLLVSPVWERFFGRFVWNRGEKSAAAAAAPPASMPASDSTALVLYSESAETVEWVNMMWRKVLHSHWVSSIIIYYPVGAVVCLNACIITSVHFCMLLSDVACVVWWFTLVTFVCMQAWRVYQRGLERWLADLLQPVFDNLIADESVPGFVQRLRILEFTLDHEAPYFDNMRRRSSRKDSDLNGVVDVRYTGGARMLLQLEVGQGRWRIKV